LRDSAEQGLRDWKINALEYPMLLENRHLWLGENDADWHTPLLVILRPRESRNRRIRSDAGQERRDERLQMLIEKGVVKGKGKKGKSAQAEKGKGKGKSSTSSGSKGKGKWTPRG
jgi:hypothetical protein